MSGRIRTKIDEERVSRRSEDFLGKGSASLTGLWGGKVGDQEFTESKETAREDKVTRHHINLIAQ